MLSSSSAGASAGASAIGLEDDARAEARVLEDSGCMDAAIDAAFLSRAASHVAFPPILAQNGRWPMLSPKAVSGHYARPA
eukprot:5898040-Prymnesium_polylepis.1